MKSSGGKVEIISECGYFTCMSDRHDIGQASANGTKKRKSTRPTARVNRFADGFSLLSSMKYRGLFHGHSTRRDAGVEEEDGTTAVMRLHPMFRAFGFMTKVTLR